jgi:WD40 repeat protein
MAKSSLQFELRQPNTMLCALWSPDGRSIATGDANGDLRVWDAQTGQCVMSWSDLKSGINSIAWSPDGSRIALSDREGRVAIWETKTGSSMFLTPTTRISSEDGEYSTHVAWSPNGRLIASSGFLRNGDMMIVVWDVQTGERLTRWPYDEYFAALQWSPNSRYLAGGDSQGTVHLWTYPTWQEVATYRRPDTSGLVYVKSIAWSEDSTRLAFGDTLDIVQVWDVTENRMLSMYTQEYNSIQEIISWNPKPIAGVAWMSGGTYLASAHRSVQIREATTGRRVAAYPDPFEGNPGYIILQVDWSPDRRRVVSVGNWHSEDRQTSEGCMYVWEVGEDVSEDHQ